MFRNVLLCVEILNLMNVVWLFEHMWKAILSSWGVWMREQGDDAYVKTV